MSLFLSLPKENGRNKYILKDLSFLDHLPSDPISYSFLKWDESEKDVQFLKFWDLQKHLFDFLPEEYAESFKQFSEDWKNFVVSFSSSKIHHILSIYDFIPDFLLEKLCFFKFISMEQILETRYHPENYDLLLKIEKMIRSFEERTIRFNDEEKELHFSQRTKTGRIKTVKPGFSILNLEKEKKNLIIPKNNEFFVLDINGADIRSTFHLLGMEQPKEDIHEFNKRMLSLSSRDDAKKYIFAWLYGSGYQTIFDDFLSKKSLLEKYFDGKNIRNPYGRIIETDEEHAINHLVQSTSNDCFFDSVWNVFQLLSGKKSFISFCHHDSVIIDLSYEDLDLVPNIAKLMMNNPLLGKIKISMSFGPSLGEQTNV